MKFTATSNKKNIEIRQSSNLPAKISYFFMCYSWIFDFRSEGAGESFATQQFFIIFYLVSFLNFFVSYKDSGIYIKGLGTTIFLSLLFILIGTVSGLLADQDYYQIFRNATNIFIYLTMAYATSKIIVSYGQRQLVNHFIFMTFAYSVSTLIIYYIRQGGIDFLSIRFQIIGPSTISAFALLFLSIIYKIPLWGYASIISSTAIVFLSVTRTYIFIAIMQFFPFMKQIRIVSGPREIILALSLITAIPSLYIYTEFISNRWEDRVSARSNSEDIDPTLYARLNEWNFMMKETFKSPLNAFFGSGFAAVTEYYLPKDISKGVESDIGFGHSNHLSLIFIAGLLGGGPLLILHILQFIASLRFIGSVIKGRMKDSDVLFLGAWGSIIIIGTFTANLFAAAFTNRGSSLWYAIGTGLFLGARACFDPHNRHILLKSMPNFYSQLAIVRRRARPIAQAKRQKADLDSQDLPAAVTRRRLALAPHSEGAA